MLMIAIHLKKVTVPLRTVPPPGLCLTRTAVLERTLSGLTVSGQSQSFLAVGLSRSLRLTEPETQPY